MNTEHIICPCCKEEVSSLVKHHWIENDGITREKEICQRCNRILWTRSGNHKMPSWEIQEKYVQWYYKPVEIIKNPYDWKENKEKYFTMTEDEEKLIGRTLYCKRCGSSWETRIISKPSQCPRCHRTDWDKDGVRKRS